MKPIDAIWIIGLLGLFYFLFIKKSSGKKEK